MPNENIPSKAGLLHERTLESTQHCLHFPERPLTPTSVAKYRKSYFAEPGRRIVHSGGIDDLKNIDYMKKFGENITISDHVSDIQSTNLPSSHAIITKSKKEAIYASVKHEPLGKGFSRGHVLPQVCHDATFAFGKNGEDTVTGGYNAKDMMYPLASYDEDAFKELYRKSHGACAPGEQKDRRYNWRNTGINPTQHRFGVTDNTAGTTGGVAQCLQPPRRNVNIVSKQMEDMKDTFDTLGKSRHLGNANCDVNYIFGKNKSCKKNAKNQEEPSAQACIQGSYTLDEQAPDSDLGKSVNAGWRNVTLESRPFGVPSIRADITPPDRRSVADNQNYGDDVDAQFLLYPDPFAANGIEDEEFAAPRQHDAIRSLFARIGHVLPDHIFTQLWENAATSTAYTPFGSVSIEEFRTALNVYLDHQGTK